MEYGTGGQKPCTTRLRRRLPAIIDASPIAAAMKTTPMATVDAERPSCTVKGLPARDGEAIVMVTPPGAKSNAFRPGTGTGGSGTRAAPCPCGACRGIRRVYVHGTVRSDQGYRGYLPPPVQRSR